MGAKVGEHTQHGMTIHGDTLLVLPGGGVYNVYNICNCIGYRSAGRHLTRRTAWTHETPPPAAECALRGRSAHVAIYINYDFDGP